MRSLLPLALLPALAGCWPYLPGTWDDYYVPDDIQILGRMMRFEYVGSDLEDMAPATNIDAFWFQEPASDLSPIHLFATRPGECTTASFSWDLFLDRAGDPGAPRMLLSGPGGGIEIPWIASAKVFEGDLTEGDYALGAHYALAELDGDDGDLEIDDFAIAPGPLDFGGLDTVGGAASVQDMRLSWDWDGSRDDVDWVILQVYAMRNGTILEAVTCSAPIEDQGIIVPTDLWTTTPDYWQINRGTARVSKRRIGDTETSSAMLFARLEISLLDVE
ncbi:MAG: hypothetical protein JXX28_00320 [Deltaproteobacteria bacterium]|nr:hypothetical protein [Deltaproteobacteria bacterium]